MSIYRQGDVLLKKVSGKPKGNLKEVSRDNGRLVLAYGEATGHAHVVVDEGNSILSKDENNRLWLEIFSHSVLQHGNLRTLRDGDHDEIALDPGIYEVIQQREYTPQRIRMSGIREMINKELIKEQKKLVSSILNDWNKISLSAECANRKEAEKGIMECYLAAGLRKPRIIWAMSPLGGLLITAIATKSRLCVKQNIWSNIFYNAYEIMAMNLWRSNGENFSKWKGFSPENLTKFFKTHSSYKELIQKKSFWDQFFYDVLVSVDFRSLHHAEPYSNASTFSKEFISDSEPYNISDTVWRGVLENLPGDLTEKDHKQFFEKFWIEYYGRYCGFNVDDFAIYDALYKVFQFEFLRPLLGQLRVARSAGLWWPFGDIAVISERPIFLSLDESGRFHGENDMAIKYQDGCGVYAWHGIRVSRKIIKTPNQITLKELESESNDEIRRIMLERYGWERYLKDSGSKPIHEDDYGLLYKRRLPDDKPIIIVKVKNSTPEPDGSFKNYFLRVPPQIKTAHQAVAWTFNMNKKEYQPTKET